MIGPQPPTDWRYISAPGEITLAYLAAQLKVKKEDVMIGPQSPTDWRYIPAGW